MLKYLLPLLLLTGCVFNSQLPKITIDNSSEFPELIVWNDFPAEKYGHAYWLQEAKQRWRHPIVFACHGGVETIVFTDNNGNKITQNVWCLFPDLPRTVVPVEYVAWTLHNLYPEHDIILCVCNSQGIDIHVPRVWYARKNIWVTPDDIAKIHPHDNAVGSIWDFVTYDGRKIPEPATRPATKPVKQELPSYDGETKSFDLK